MGDPQDPQDQMAHQDHWVPQPHHHHHHHHHAQLSVSHNVYQHAHHHAAHRRNIRKRADDHYSFVGWIIASISLQCFLRHHEASSLSFCDDLPTFFTTYVNLVKICNECE